jgi:D-alanyl-D-alanine carboxypeptidase (penicillin-binding protein 5/6)
MARELISHEAIKGFSTIWTDTARSGEFGLSNTNRLIHNYKGATGLKTGFTDGAKYCLAATAERDGDAYIAAVLGADTSNDRFDSASTLLSFAFAGYTLCDLTECLPLPPIPVTLGKDTYVQPVYADVSKTLLEKSGASLLRCVPSLPADLEAPIEAGQLIGTVQVYVGDTMYTEIPVCADRDIPRMGVWDIFKHMLLTRFT